MTAAPLLVGCALHDGADIDACGCPALDSPGAIAYRGLLVKARAEIARLTAELAAARAVTAGVCRYLDCAASDLLAVVTSLYETRARAISDATAARGTVGGLLATAPVGAIVEFVDCAFWYQARVHVDDSVEWYETRRRHATDARWMPWKRGIPPVRPSARLVPAAEADADPNQRGPLLAATAPVCPGPDCPMCSGEACDKCNPGPGRPRCDHDGQERHEPPTAAPRPQCPTHGDTVSCYCTTGALHCHDCGHTPPFCTACDGYHDAGPCPLPKGG